MSGLDVSRLSAIWTNLGVIVAGALPRAPSPRIRSTDGTLQVLPCCRCKRSIIWIAEAPAFALEEGFDRGEGRAIPGRFVLNGNALGYVCADCEQRGRPGFVERIRRRVAQGFDHLRQRGHEAVRQAALASRRLRNLDLPLLRRLFGHRSSPDVTGKGDAA